MPKYIPLEYITHVRRVKSLYKRMLRWSQSIYDGLYEQRIDRALIRKEFDDNMHIKDPIIAKQLIEAGEREVKIHDLSMRERLIFPDSYDGVAEDTEPLPTPDWVLDFWYPLEKAQYPFYFALREKRKLEFMQWYDRQYGKPAYLEDVDEVLTLGVSGHDKDRDADIVQPFSG